MRSIRALPFPRPDERWIAFLIALALQISFLLLLIQAIEKAGPAHQALAREFTLVLRQISLPARPASPTSGGHGSVRPHIAPPAAMPSVPQAIPLVPPSALQGFGQALNDCAPENYAGLPDDKKALCARPGQGVVVREAPDLMGTPSTVKDAARWANALAHEQSPPWLPCSVAVRGPFGSGPGFDLACLVEAFAAGTLTDPMSWPTYRVKQLQPEDFYKIEQAYDDWHAAHGKAPAQ